MFDANLRAVKEGSVMATLEMLSEGSVLYEAGLRQGDCVMVNMLSPTEAVVVATKENVRVGHEGDDKFLVYAGQRTGSGFTNDLDKEFTLMFAVLLDYALKAREVRNYPNAPLSKTLERAYSSYRKSSQIYS